MRRSYEQKQKQQSAKVVKPVNKITFDAKLYVRPGLTESQVLEIKEAFDMFDSDCTGLV